MPGCRDDAHVLTTGRNGVSRPEALTAEPVRGIESTDGCPRHLMQPTRALGVIGMTVGQQDLRHGSEVRNRL